VLHAPQLLKSVGPNSLNNRYVTEDVPYALVPMSGLASLVGMQTPVVDSLTTLASALMGIDYWTEGRNLAKLGFSALTIAELKQFLLNGNKQE
ncbi:MAG: dehydrogenase, partial [Candidatus Lokiarchaeota archaeon]|nr:dehydrogenase [Candidatus Lokiarchaeota archaeon]